ncbi:hypothetical protein [Crassaminicella profunda]|uniref:hypothetical protein n=1 Tax=Crassaminicella profunda TaxID=1286698 RepID=UPI001CA605F6|nr:hypothetical protein [Crassaminicella profunda]QZY54475.1 hypothetical protein K7H06_15735 [Crassaminicella profunda]
MITYKRIAINIREIKKKDDFSQKICNKNKHYMNQYLKRVSLIYKNEKSELQPPLDNRPNFMVNLLLQLEVVKNKEIAYLNTIRFQKESMIRLLENKGIGKSDTQGFYKIKNQEDIYSKKEKFIQKEFYSILDKYSKEEIKNINLVQKIKELNHSYTNKEELIPQNIFKEKNWIEEYNRKLYKKIGLKTSIRTYDIKYRVFNKKEDIERFREDTKLFRENINPTRNKEIRGLSSTKVLSLLQGNKENKIIGYYEKAFHIKNVLKKEQKNQESSYFTKEFQIKKGFNQEKGFRITESIIEKTYENIENQIKHLIFVKKIKDQENIYRKKEKFIQKESYSILENYLEEEIKNINFAQKIKESKNSYRRKDEIIQKNIEKEKNNKRSIDRNIGEKIIQRALYHIEKKYKVKFKKTEIEYKELGWNSNQVELFNKKKTTEKKTEIIHDFIEEKQSVDALIKEKNWIEEYNRKLYKKIGLKTSIRTYDIKYRMFNKKEDIERFREDTKLFRENIKLTKNKEIRGLSTTNVLSLLQGNKENKIIGYYEKAFHIKNVLKKEQKNQESSYFTKEFQIKKGFRITESIIEKTYENIENQIKHLIFVKKIKDQEDVYSKKEKLIQKENDSILENYLEEEIKNINFAQKIKESKNSYSRKDESIQKNIAKEKNDKRSIDRNLGQKIIQRALYHIEKQYKVKFKKTEIEYKELGWNSNQVELFNKKKTTEKKIEIIHDYIEKKQSVDALIKEKNWIEEYNRKLYKKIGLKTSIRTYDIKNRVFNKKEDIERFREDTKLFRENINPTKNKEIRGLSTTKVLSLLQGNKENKIIGYYEKAFHIKNILKKEQKNQESSYFTKEFQIKKGFNQEKGFRITESIIEKTYENIENQIKHLIFVKKIKEQENIYSKKEKFIQKESYSILENYLEEEIKNINFAQKIKESKNSYSRKDESIQKNIEKEKNNKRSIDRNLGQKIIQRVLYHIEKQYKVKFKKTEIEYKELGWNSNQVNLFNEEKRTKKKIEIIHDYIEKKQSVDALIKEKNWIEEYNRKLYKKIGLKTSIRAYDIKNRVFNKEEDIERFREDTKLFRENIKLTKNKEIRGLSTTKALSLLQGNKENKIIGYYEKAFHIKNILKKEQKNQESIHVTKEFQIKKGFNQEKGFRITESIIEKTYENIENQIKHFIFVKKIKDQENIYRKKENISQKRKDRFLEKYLENQIKNFIFVKKIKDQEDIYRKKEKLIQKENYSILENYLEEEIKNINFSQKIKESKNSYSRKDESIQKNIFKEKNDKRFIDRNIGEKIIQRALYHIEKHYKAKIEKTEIGYKDLEWHSNQVDLFNKKKTTEKKIEIIYGSIEKQQSVGNLIKEKNWIEEYNRKLYKKIGLKTSIKPYRMKYMELTQKNEIHFNVEKLQEKKKLQQRMNLQRDNSLTYELQKTNTKEKMNSIKRENRIVNVNHMVSVFNEGIKNIKEITMNDKIVPLINREHKNSMKSDFQYNKRAKMEFKKSNIKKPKEKPMKIQPQSLNRSIEAKMDMKKNSESISDSEINKIMDKVYKKLEKKLKFERIRRGI